MVCIQIEIEKSIKKRQCRSINMIEKFYEITKDKIKPYKMTNTPITNEKFLKIWNNKLNSLKNYEINKSFWYKIENENSEDICIKFYTTNPIGSAVNLGKIRSEWFKWTYGIIIKLKLPKNYKNNKKEYIENFFSTKDFINDENIIKFIF